MQGKIGPGNTSGWGQEKRVAGVAVTFAMKLLCRAQKANPRCRRGLFQKNLRQNRGRVDLS